jgi:ABC-2 type transport system ATP-binding protein
VDTLSKGYRHRTCFAQSIIHDPDVLILDEPTDGLDPNQKHEVRALINSMAPNKAIVLSTHILEEVEAVCTRAVIIARGRIVADGTPAELRSRSKYHNAVNVKIKPDGGGPNPDSVRGELERLPAVSRVEVLAGENGHISLLVFPKGHNSIVSEIGTHARGRGWQLDELHVDAGRLDDVFRSITTRKEG